MICARYGSIILTVTGAMPDAGASPFVRITGALTALPKMQRFSGSARRFRTDG